MKINRFEPWSYVDLMHRNLRQSSPPQAATQWTPAVDIIEEKTRFSLRADLPGVRAEDIEITMDAGVLTVSGSRHSDNNDEDSALRRSERRSGRFLRQFALPDTTDGENIKAKTSNGILEVSIPKLAEVAARQITVEAA